MTQVGKACISLKSENGSSTAIIYAEIWERDHPIRGDLTELCLLPLAEPIRKMISWTTQRFAKYTVYALFWIYVLALRWRHNERDGVSNHRRIHSLPSGCFRRRSKKTSKLRVTGLCAANYAENASIWWCHHGLFSYIFHANYPSNILA